MVEIRQCQLTDKDRLIKLNTYLKTRHSTDFWNEIMGGDRNVNQCYVAMTNTNEIVGYIISKGHQPMTQFSIAVDEAYRRKGVGTQLMKEMTNHACSSDDYIELKVRVSNAGAQEFYKHLGFEQTEVRPHYYSDHEDAIIMRRKCA